MELPDAIYNWLINFHQDRSHATKYSGLIFTIARINASIAQGSGIGPTAYDVGASDLHPIDQANVIVKFADDTYLISASENRDTMHAELQNIDAWATRNNLRLNKSKPREMVVLPTAKGVR